MTAGEQYNIDYLEKLEAESIHIIRETVATMKRPVMLYSIGKDSSVMLRLAEKAFAPEKIPFPLQHVDTGFKFHEMIAFRDAYIKKIGARLLVEKNEEPEAQALRADDAHTDRYIYIKKTKPLLNALKKGKFDAAFGGARRDEEKSRAKERIFSLRSESAAWDPKNQRPELWHIYNTQLLENQTMRIFPLSNWTELDIWMYIKRDNIEIVPLYFAKEREVVKRHGVLLRLDQHVQPKNGEEIKKIFCRYRTLGCSPSTGCVPSTATTVDEIIQEVLESKVSERETRAIDYGTESAMEDKKREGYF